MSAAQITEAHRVITESVCELLDSEEMIGPSPVERAAQLIADSEARAVAEIAMVAAESADRNVSLRLERDQLRAEAERLKRDYDYDHKCLHEVRERCELWKQRAERAEREVERLKPYVSKAVLTHEGTMLCSPLVAVKFNEQATRAERAEAEVVALKAQRGQSDYYAAALSAEAELATAKAIIASIEEDGTEEHNAAVGLRQELATERARLDWLELRGPWDSWNGFGETGITLRENIREAIDAAMKEGSA